VGCGGSHSLLKLVSAVEAAAGTCLAPRFEAARAGDVMHSCADISPARSLLEYVPLVSFQEGVRRTFEAVEADMSSARLSTP